MKNSVDQALEVAKKFVKETMPFYDPEKVIDPVQLMTSLHPYIANAMYAHGNEVIERERMETLITLARTLDNENIEKVVKNLRYTIAIKK